MVVMPVAGDNNPLENLINRIDVQVTSLQMNFSKVKNLIKLIYQKRATKWSTLHF